jgi:hypothetical protein
LIKEKDVIRMKVPFPSVSAGLALQSHMYICGKDTEPDYGFIKCQTLKPYMLGSNIIIHYVDETPNLSRNPFGRTSRIDCDKFFITSSVRYDDGLKTTSRPDVCQELYDDVKYELETDGYKTIPINENELVALNYLITKI